MAPTSRSRAVGAENIFIFGLTADEVMARRKLGYSASAAIDQHDGLRSAIELLESGLSRPVMSAAIAPSPTISAISTTSC